MLQCGEQRDPAQRGIYQVGEISGWQVARLQGEGVIAGLPEALDLDQGCDNVAYREPLLLFHNSAGQLKNVTHESGPAFAHPMSARGLALGDFNNDGAVDVLISCNDEAPVLLQNNAGLQNHWLGVKLIGKKANIDGIGAVLNYQAGDLKRSRMKVGGGSYLSSHDPRMVLGIGKRAKLDWIEIKWPQPSGVVQRLTDLPIDRYVTIREGQTKWE